MFSGVGVCARSSTGIGQDDCASARAAAVASAQSVNQHQHAHPRELRGGVQGSQVYVLNAALFSAYRLLDPPCMQRLAQHELLNQR